jgi:hypothetical protein
MMPSESSIGGGKKQLYGNIRHPYYVVAPDYQRTSAGIRVMHQFCAALRMCGQEAWISTGTTNPLLDTPKLTREIQQQHLEQGQIPIAVYPEVVGRNPLQCHVVTRYILNKPGLLGEKPHYKDSDLLFVYEPELLTEVSAPWGVLHLPSIDTSIFHNRGNSPDRQGWCVYPGRYSDGLKDHAALLADCMVITRNWPSTREEMAALFQRSEGVFCFENTAISMEARLCGCPVVQLPSPLYDKARFFGLGLGLARGISFSTAPENIEAARHELIGLSQGYQALEDQFWSGLDQWIQDTQKLAINAAKTKPSSIVDDTPIDEPRYKDWYQLNTPGESTAQHLATRMMLDWTEPTSVHLLMAVMPDELSAFEQTLATLSTQVFESWMLTVASTAAQPAHTHAQQRIQWLEARETRDLDVILHEMAKISGGDWLGFLPTGIQLDALGLQALVDAAQSHPSWQLVYSDNDIQTADGRAHHPRLKPKSDLITLCGTSLVDGLTLVRKTAYTAAIPAAQAGLNPAYPLSLALLANGQIDAIGHVDGIWAHLPERTNARPNEGEREAAIKHLRQANINADVQHRSTANLRIVEPLPLQPAPLPVTAVLVGADTLEACLALWRQLYEMIGALGLHDCLIAHRLTSPHDIQLLKMAVSQQSGLPTSVVDLPNLNDGETLAAICMQITAPLAWILGPGTAPVQPDGLLHLTNWMHWPKVAAVQPGLWSLAEGQMLSPGFSPGLAWEPLALSPETNDNAATQQRALACLNGEGILIRTPILQRTLQLMSGSDRAVWPLALSRELAQMGHTMVWKPEVVMSVSVKATPSRQSKHLFMTQNLPWLTSNGPYNPRLSLRKPALVDATRSVPWAGTGTNVRRGLLLQDEEILFPQAHLTHLARVGEATELSMTLWSVSAADSADILFFEIVRAAPHAVYFGKHTPHGPLAGALALMAEHCPKILRLCCIGPVATSGSEIDNWTLVEWLHQHQHALRSAHRALACETALADVLRPYHPDIQCIEHSSADGPAGHLDHRTHAYLP